MNFGFGVSINNDIPKLDVSYKLGVPTTPIKAGIKNDAYYKQIELFARNYVHSHYKDYGGKPKKGDEGLKSFKQLVKDFTKIYNLPNISKDIKDVDINAAKHYTSEKYTSNKERQQVTYMMYFVDKIIDNINTNVTKSNIQTAKIYNVDDTSSLQDKLDVNKIDVDFSAMSKLDIGIVRENVLRKKFEVETIDYASFEKLVRKKMISSRYGADPTAYTFRALADKSLTKNQKFKQLIKDIRSGAKISTEYIAKVANYKSVRSLRFLSNLYRSVVEQGWSDIKDIFDQLTPSEIEKVYNNAKDELEKLGKQIEFVFKYREEQTDDISDIHDILLDEARQMLYKHMKKEAEKKDAQEVLDTLNKIAGRKVDKVDVNGFTSVNDVFAGAEIKL